MLTSQIFGRAAVLLLLIASQLGCELRSGETRTFKSADGRYVVEASGRFTSPLVPVIENVVRVRVLRDGSTLVQGRKVTRADSFDRGFDTKYGPPNWVAPNILRFPQNRQAPRSDTVVLRNRSGKTLKYLEIVTRDLLLLFDVPAGADMELPVTSQDSGNTTFIRATVIQEDAEGIKAQTNYDREPGLPGVRVGVDVNPDGVALHLLNAR
jgi:hypothetical protein